MPTTGLKEAIAMKEIEVDALDRNLDSLRDSVRREEKKRAAEAAKLTYLKLHSVATPEGVALADEVGKAVHSFDAGMKPAALRSSYTTAKGEVVEPPAVVADDEISYQDMDDYGDINGVESQLETALEAVSGYLESNPGETSNALSMLLLVTEAFAPLCLSHGSLESRAESLGLEASFIVFCAQIRAQQGYAFGVGVGSNDLLSNSAGTPTERWPAASDHNDFVATRTEALNCSAFDEMLSSILDMWATCMVGWVTQNNKGTTPPPETCVEESEILLQLVEHLLGPSARKAAATKVVASVRELLDMD